MWYLRMSNATTNVNADIVSNFGAGTDIPVVGDWTHSGLDYIGVFRPSGATWFFATCLYCYGPGATGSWPFGTGTDYPLAGAWDGSLIGGVANVGQAPS